MRRPPGINRGAEALTVVTSVLSTGVLFGTVTSLTPSKRSWDPHTYTTVQQATVRNLRPVMGTLLPLSVLGNLLALRGTGAASSRARARAAVGLLGPLASLLLTAGYELPINAQVLAWDPDRPPADWTTVRDRWETVHVLRTATALVGLAGTLLATRRGLGRPPSGSGCGRA